MGRRAKFTLGNVVSWNENHYNLYGVVVAHEVGEYGDSFYTVVTSDKFGKHIGRRRRFRSHLLKPVKTPSGNTRTRKGIAKAYRINLSYEDRTCECHCCAHP